jgi:hypothetical protein
MDANLELTVPLAVIPDKVKFVIVELPMELMLDQYLAATSAIDHARSGANNTRTTKYQHNNFSWWQKCHHNRTKRSSIWKKR